MRRAEQKLSYRLILLRLILKNRVCSNSILITAGISPLLYIYLLLLWHNTEKKVIRTN